MRVQPRAIVAGGVLLVAIMLAAHAEIPARPGPVTSLPSWLSHGEVDALTAEAELRNSHGEHVGHAVLIEAPYGVTLAIEVSNLSPGRHGFHVHEVGLCDPPDFASAGGHFNPRGKQHGLMTIGGPHVGDLPNLVAGPDGTARAEIYLAHATLGAGSNSLVHPHGTAIIVHANSDDQRADPGGNSGARIACGVIALR